MNKCKYIEDNDITCECKGADQTMGHLLLECPELKQTCSMAVLILCNDKAKDCVVVVCLPGPLDGMGRLKFSDLFTELPVPP